MNTNYQTVYQNLPYKVKGFVTYNTADDFYTIVLNSRHSHSMNVETYKHELKHITNEDFYNPLNINNIESIRH